MAEGLMLRHRITEAEVLATPVGHVHQRREREAVERPALEMQDARVRIERPWEVYSGYEGLLAPHREERYIAEWAPGARHVLCCADVQPLGLGELLSLSDDRSLEQWGGLQLGAVDPRGSAALRGEVARLYGAPTQEDVLVCGPQEAAYLCMRAVLRKGDHVVAQWPGPQGLVEVAKSVGARVTLWRPEEGPRGELHFSITMLRALMSASSPAIEPRLCAVCFPHSPTGQQPSHAEWAEIVDICRKHGSYLFADESYRMTEYQEEDMLQPAVDMYELGLSVGGVGRPLGLDGLRVGWVVTRVESLRLRLLQLKDYTSVCGSGPSEALAAAALRARGALVRRHRELVAANLTHLRAFMDEHRGLFSWTPPQAGPTAMVNLLPPSRMGAETSEGYAARLARTQGVVVLPDAALGMDGGSRIRVGFGRRDFPQALEALRGAVRRLGPHLGPLAEYAGGGG